MRNPGLFLFGLVAIALGFIFLFDITFGFELIGLLWPIGLIIAGIALILQRNNKSSLPGVSKRNHAFISEIKRDGHWIVEDEEFSAFISDLTLDLTHADIPKGETVYSISGFIGDVNIRVPEGLGVMVTSSSFISDNSVLGSSETGFLGPKSLKSSDYDIAEHQLRIEASHFIGDITVKVSQDSSINLIEEKSPLLLS